MLSCFPVRLVVVLAAVVVAACEKVPLGAPTQSRITVSAASRALAPGASTEVTAFVVEQSGTPVQNGTLVRFMATLGSVNPIEVETRGGLAVTTFTAANASGTARVTATSGSATGGDDTSNVVEIQIGAAAANSVTVNASPARVSTTGGTATIVASVLDATGNRLTGIPVTFTTTAGTLSANSAATDSNGEARIQLTTNREATVTAAAGGKTATVKVEVGAPASVTLSTTPASPTAGSPVTLKVTPASGTAPRVTVTWGDGRSEDLGVVASERSVTHTYTTSGSYVITATATQDGESATTSTSVSVASAAGFDVAVSPTTKTQTIGSPVTLTVTPKAGASPRVAIDWGDNDTIDLGVLTAARSVSHTYRTTGNFTIVLTGRAGGDSVTTHEVVTINARSPIGVTIPAPTSPTKCASITLTATVTPTGETISTYDWTIDGTAREDATIRTTGNTLTRVFRDSGIKTVSVVATTPDGRTGSGDVQFNIPVSTAVCE